MARSSISVQRITRSGANPSFESANTDGNSFDHHPDGFVWVKNGDTASKTVTIPTPRSIDGLSVADLTVDVPAGEDRAIGPFPEDTFKQDDGTIHVDYSDVTSVTVGAFRA